MRTVCKRAYGSSYFDIIIHDIDHKFNTFINLLAFCTTPSSYFIHFLLIKALFFAILPIFCTFCHFVIYININNQPRCCTVRHRGNSHFSIFSKAALTSQYM